MWTGQFFQHAFQLSTLDNVFGESIRFLREHPPETVMIRLKELPPQPEAGQREAGQYEDVTETGVKYREERMATVLKRLDLWI